MNVLLTCGGSRQYMLQAFKDAIGDCGVVLTCDAAADAPALQLADKGFLVPEISDPLYVATLLELCRHEHVHLLIPAMEQELVLLARCRADFESVGTLALVSAPDIVDRCYDKVAAAAFLDRCGVLVPRTYLSLDAARAALWSGDAGFPMVVKPRWGVSSTGLMFAGDEDELEWSWRLVGRIAGRSTPAAPSASDPERSVLIQECVAGEEYGFDVVNDLHGRYAATLVRRKLRMKGGQTDRAETVAPEAIGTMGERIGRGLGHIGVLDCDAIQSRSGLVVLDINPRIGGGYPFSHLAGANVPAALLAWAGGHTALPEWLRAEPNIRGARHDSLLVLDGRRERRTMPSVEIPASPLSGTR